MTVTKTDRGFELVEHDTYGLHPVPARLVQQSSAINFDYDDGLDSPGSSFFWIGKLHHLNREEVGELIGLLKTWIETGRLSGEPRKENNHG